MTVLVKNRTHRAMRRPRQRESYLKKRSVTIRCLFFLLAGVLLGSIYAVAAGKDSLVCTILVHQLSTTPECTLWGLLRERLLFAAILVFYLLIAGGSLWGKYLIPAAPLLFGLSQGINITYLLILLGWNSWRYLTVCIILPKAILTAILLILCNISYQRFSVFSSTGEPQKGGGMSALWWVAVIALLLECLLEQFLRMKLIGWIIV